MPKGVSGWTLNDLRNFLKSHKFTLAKELGGSHQAWVSEDGKFVVEVNITHDTFPERTLETMVVNSGLSKDHWKRWTKLSSRDKKKARCCKK